tara:strand:- start:4252 stop:4443 length:192 start_codon:yes stop_codon:yes gene_type:complete
MYVIVDSFLEDYAKCYDDTGSPGVFTKRLISLMKTVMRRGESTARTELIALLEENKKYANSNS